MIKKLIVATGAAALLSTFVFGRDVVSYAKTFGSNVREAVKSEIDLEFEVDRARQMVEELMPWQQGFQDFFGVATLTECAINKCATILRGNNANYFT